MFTIYCNNTISCKICDLKIFTPYCRKSIEKIQAKADKVWRLQILDLTIQFNQVWFLPPPFTLISLVARLLERKNNLSFCKFYTLLLYECKLKILEQNYKQIDLWEASNKIFWILFVERRDHIFLQDYRALNYFINELDSWKKGCHIYDILKMFLKIFQSKL